MKSSKSLRQPYGNSERKNGKREKAAKLDRKSSRGMIYENEELRLRTININAEVERGQSDIKRLRRENEHLRREIWTLRDECDRLNKRFKAKLLEHDHGGCSARGSGASCRHSGHCDGTHSTCNSDDSDSCDTCKGNDDQCSDDCCASGSCTQLSATQPIVQEAPDTPTVEQPHVSEAGVVSTKAGAELPQNLHNAFDHLSVVSEETLSNSELQSQGVQNEHLLGYTPDSSGSQMTIPSIIGPLTPLTPIEQVANQLNDLQAVVPPLSYFENVLQQHMGSNIGNSPLSPTTAKVVRHTNGWDYNIQSPFAQRKFLTGNAPAPPTVTRTQRFAQAPHTNTLSTFAPSVSVEDVDVAVATTTTNNTAINAPAIETVAITTMPTALNSPKHFFAPIKPRLKINTTLANKNLPPPVPPPVVPTTAAPTSTTAAGMSTVYNASSQNCEPPDIYVANALATPYQRQQMPAAAMPPPLPQRGSSSQTDSVNLEAILNDIETISEDILAIQMEKKKLRENHNGVADMNRPLQEADKNKKPYRSEMNLLLQYDGANPTITPSKPAIATQTSFVSSNSSNGRSTRALESEQTDTDSPAPHMPDPMAPFPDKRTYLGFEQPNNTTSGTATATIGGVRLQRPPLPPSQVVAAAPGSLLGTPVKVTPPIPPVRILPPTLNIRAATVGRGTPVGTPQAPTLEESAKQPPYIPGLAPNKSHLYAAVANAAAKRAQFRATPSQLTGSVDVVSPVGQENVNESPMATEDAANAEAARRKARRVSIVCGETSNPATPDQTPNQTFNRSQAQSVSSITNNMMTNTHTNSSNTNITNNTTTHPMAAGSCTDLPSVLMNPALKNLKQTSHSTPSTPHSARRRSNSNTMLTNNSELTTQSANNSPEHLPSLQLQQLQPNVNSSCSNLSAAQQRKDSVDSTRDLAAEIIARSKCSRRHSDGTVVSNTRRNSAGHHHHHHHHHHQHSSSVISNNPHHSHHSHQDSNHETGTSSDRNSGSLASSRESSTSFSVRSHRRKISVSSHTGGKIPWCGCWGNGCL